MPRFDEPDVTAEDILSATTKDTIVIDWENFTAVGRTAGTGRTEVPSAQVVVEQE